MKSNKTLKELLEKYNIGSLELLDKDLEMCHKIIYEYGQIEEELGIDLITFMKVRYAYFKEKIVYIRRKNKLVSGTIKYIGEKTIWISYYNKQNFTYPVATLKLKDYGKTWALTKEEIL